MKAALLKLVVPFSTRGGEQQANVDTPEVPVVKLKASKKPYNGTGYQNKELEKKRQKAIAMLGNKWRILPDNKFVAKGEFHLTLYWRTTAIKRPAVSIITGRLCLLADIKDIVDGLVMEHGQSARVYIGDLKLMGDQSS